jgi:hypothetical protein
MVTHNPENEAFFHRTLRLRDGLVDAEPEASCRLQAAG